METAALVDDRQRWLLDRLTATRRVITTQVAQELGVSVDTVRRDLRALHSRGLVRRVHGGAVPVSQLSTSFTARSEDDGSSRAALADAVAGRFQAGQVIGLDAGSTNVDVAARIPDSLPVTIVTNSPAAAMAMADHPSADVILLGGIVDLTWMAATGSDVVDAWRDHHLDIAVVGACGFGIDFGVTTRSVGEVATKRALIAAGAEVILPLQHEKLDTLAPFRVAGAEEIDVLVVDQAADPGAIAACRSAGLDVVGAEVAVTRAW